MFEETRAIVYMKSKIVYHLVLFICFVAAVMLHGFAVDFLSKYIPWAWLQPYAGYLLVYIAALHLFPIIGFGVAKSMMK